MQTVVALRPQQVCLSGRCFTHFKKSLLSLTRRQKTLASLTFVSFIKDARNIPHRNGIFHYVAPRESSSVLVREGALAICSNMHTCSYPRLHLLIHVCGHVSVCQLASQFSTCGGFSVAWCLCADSQCVRAGDQSFQAFLASCRNSGRLCTVRLSKRHLSLTLLTAWD